MKRTGSWYALICLSAVIVVGCGGSQPKETPATPPPAATPAPAPAATPPAPPPKAEPKGIADGIYYVKAAKDSQVSCVDIGSEHVTKKEATMHRFTCNGSVYQKWQISPDTNRPDRYVISYSGIGDKFWEAEGRKPAAKNVAFNRRDDNAYQSWRLKDNGDGTYLIANDGTSKCVDYNAGKKAKMEDDLKLSGCDAQFPEQHWYIVPIS